MIIICDGVINAGDLELAEPEMMLNDDTSLATYSMHDKYDSSGNARDLVTDNEFTTLGMKTIADSAHGANTGIIETDEMTFALCINMSQPTVSGRIFSNFYPGVAPFSGIQLRIEPNGALILQIATGDVNNVPAGTISVTSVEHGEQLVGGRASRSRYQTQRLQSLDRVVNAGQRRLLNGINRQGRSCLTVHQVLSRIWGCRG